MSWRSSPWVLWLALLAAHLWLCFISLAGQAHPLGDVTLVYQTWMQQGFDGQGWVGIDRPWVYPILAIVPMLIAWIFGPEHYAYTWLALMTIVDSVALGFLIGWHGTVRNAAAAWWWMAFLVLLGPIALARLDTVTVPLGIIGVLFLSTRPRLASVILTVATWIKVWPGALLVAIVVTVRSRWRIIVSAIAASVVIAGFGLVLGSGINILSFLGMQADRGLQIEAPVSTPWLWQAAAGVPNTRVYYDTNLLTFQVTGDGTFAVSALMTPLLACVAIAILLLGVLAARGDRRGTTVFAPLALALVAALIAFNKVGSPQYMAWLVVPVVLGIVQSHRGVGMSFRVPASITLVVAALTQVIYPYLYDELLVLDPVMLVVLTVRNTLLFVLLGWAVTALCRCVRTPSRERRGNTAERDRLDYDNNVEQER